MFVVMKAIQECPLRESATALVNSGLDTLGACPDAVLTRERAVTFDTPLLAQSTSQYPSWFQVQAATGLGLVTGRTR